MNMRITLLLSLCAGAAGLSVATKSGTRMEFMKNPRSLMLKDMSEVDQSEMIPVELKDFKPLKIMTYPAKQDKFVSKMLQKSGVWETEAVQNLIDSYKKHGSKGNILDVGGNIGSFAVPLADALKKGNPDSILVTVEASPRNQEHLKAGIKVNNLDNVHLYPYAVGSEDGPDNLVFKQSSWNQGKSQVDLENTAAEYTVTVPATTIDSIMDQNAAMKKIFAMKMDIEGFEYYAMMGGKRFLKENPPCVVFVELAHTKPHRDYARILLEKNGYEKLWNDKQSGWFEQKDMQKCLARL